MIITGGAHQAIVDRAWRRWPRPGDAVLIESLTYAGVCHVAERLGLRLHGLAIDEEGLLPEALERAARRPGAAPVRQSDAHNPTTATMSPSAGARRSSPAPASTT